MVFERKVLRKIFGPTNENSFWRIKTKQEVDKIIKHKNIIHFVTAQRLGRFGHIEESKKQEWLRQYTPGNPSERGQWGDQRYAGRTMFEKIYRN
jgi:hypothetical protein